MSLNIDPKTGKIGYLIDLREGATVVLFQLVFSKSAIAEKEAQLTALSSPANESDRPPAPADQDEANAKGGQKQVAEKFSHIAVLAPTLLNRGNDTRNVRSGSKAPLWPRASGQARKAPLMGVDRFHSNLTTRVRVRLICFSVPSDYCHLRRLSHRGEGPGPARRGPCPQRARSPTNHAQCQDRFQSAKRSAPLRPRFSS
jgi:hypothetical protein